MNLTDPVAIAEFWSGVSAALFFGGVGLAFVIMSIAGAVVLLRRYPRQPRG